MASLVLDASANADLVLAPELMLTEVANALWRLQQAAELADHIEPDRHLQVEALAWACHLDHPVVDCLYLALARPEAAVILTGDQRLPSAAGSAGAALNLWPISRRRQNDGSHIP